MRQDRLILFLLLVGFGFFLHGQKPQAPSKQQPRKNIGKYQVELSGCCQTIDVSLFDAEGKSINGSDFTGLVQLFYPDGSKIELVLRKHIEVNFVSAKPTY